MIFYFSATGNSLYTAQKLALSLQEPICNIIDFINQNNFNYILKQGERFGLVFPVYAWGLPKPVITFLQNIQISSFTPYYTFAVITCGENIGTSMNTLKKILKKKNIYLNSGFSIAMPDNYVVLFDVMSKEQQTEKLDKADKIIYKIAKMIALQKNNFFRVEKGKFPLLKSTLLHYLFHHFYTNTKHFYTTGDCIGCGKCEALCPTHIIHMKSEKPYWDKGNCYMCLACLNYCPKEAIQYTKKTEKHGRYHNTRL
jgi:ferredoxin/flavodoxin